MHRAWAARRAWRVRLWLAAGLALLLLPLALLVHPAWALVSLLGLLYPSRWEEQRALADLDRRHGLAYRSALEAPANHPWRNQLQTEAKTSLLDARLPAVPWVFAALYLTVVAMVWVLPQVHLPFGQPPAPAHAVSGPEAAPTPPGPAQPDPGRPLAAEQPPPEEPQPDRQTGQANDPTQPAPPAEPGQQAQEHRDVQNQEAAAQDAARPDQPGQNLQDRTDAQPAPQNGQTGQNQPGQVPPNQNGQPQTNQPPQDAQPGQVGHQQPQQTQPGQAQPPQPGQQPTQPGQAEPAQNRQAHPSQQPQPGQAQPVQPGQAQPAQPGLAQPGQQPTPPGQAPQGQNVQGRGQEGGPEEQGQQVRPPAQLARPAGEAPLIRGENRQGRPMPLPSPWEAGQPPKNVQRQAEQFLESEPLPPEVRDIVRRYFELPEQ